MITDKLRIELPGIPVLNSCRAFCLERVAGYCNIKSTSKHRWALGNIYVVNYNYRPAVCLALNFLSLACVISEIRSVLYVCEDWHCVVLRTTLRLSAMDVL